MQLLLFAKIASAEKMFYVDLMVEVNEQQYNDSIRSYVNRELRSLGDVGVGSPCDYLIYIVGHVRPDSPQTIFLGFVYVEFETRGSSKLVRIRGSSISGFIYKLQTLSSMIVADLDTQYLEPRRKRQKGGVRLLK